VNRSKFTKGDTNADKMAELLLANKADVNAKNLQNETPLNVAAFTGQTDVAELLIGNRADVNNKNKMGDTPLHWAAANGKKDFVDLLLANRATVNAENNSGVTPLDCAVSNGHEVVAELLRQHGARATKTDAASGMVNLPVIPMRVPPSLGQPIQTIQFHPPILHFTGSGIGAIQAGLMNSMAGRR